jgi:hypothetical protein
MFRVGIDGDTFGFWTRVAYEEGYIRTDMSVIRREKSGFLVCWVDGDCSLAVGELN